MRLVSTIIKSCLSGLLLMLCMTEGAGQQTTANSNDAAGRREKEDIAAIRARLVGTDTRYRIGPGDVLEVRVARAPELSREAVRRAVRPSLQRDLPWKPHL